MKILQNRTVAIIITAIIVIAAIFLSGSMKLGRERSAVEQMFYSGVENDGYSIERDLTARIEAAYNLMSIGGKYIGATETVSTALSGAREELNAAENIAAKYAANRKLTEAVEDYYTVLETKNLSEQDTQFAIKQYREIKSRNMTISRDGYNEKAQAFNNTLNGFPASIFGVAPLEMFQ